MDRLATLCIIRAVTTVNAPWERNSIDRPSWDPKVVAICLVMKIFLGRTYDTIESYLKSNTFVAQRLKVEEQVVNGLTSE